MQSDSNAPSKVSGQYDSVVGTVKEVVGGALGATETQNAGAAQHLKGETEYKAAQATGYAEGTKDYVGGKVDQVAGAVTGDSAQELKGKAQAEKGSAQQELNKHV